MRTNGKKKISLFLAILLGLASFSACDFLGNTASVGENSSVSESVEEEKDSFDILYESKNTVTLDEGAETEISIGKEIGDKNYLRIQLLTDKNLVGYIHYTNVKNPSKTHKEKIYIEQGSSEFTMFLDAFRVGAFGDFSKKIDKITLQNVGTAQGNLLVKEVAISDRKYDNQEMLYIGDHALKIGVSLAAGGALCHVERLNRGVVEYIDKDGKVRIDENIDASKVVAITDEVNLINIHDLGREVQQSYYASVDENNGYAPDDDVLYDGIGDSVLYNPVQAGSAGDKQTQIIDYRQTNGKIYVKSRPQDWFFRNTQTDSYMESTYTLGEYNTLIVTNRFVNFSQFNNMESTPIVVQEIPAVYTVHPLNYFYCETVDGVINDPNLKPATTGQPKLSVGDAVLENYYYMLLHEKVLGSWMANVNDKGFGLGMYMPNVERYTASRGWTMTTYALDYNHLYNQTMYDLAEYRFTPSAYVSNYNYFSPNVERRMADFIPFEYSFAMCVGTVEDMKYSFFNLASDGAIDNSGMDAWEKI